MLILASKSPRRKEILSSFISSFKIIPSSFDESKIHVKNKNLSKALSLYKAKDIFKQYPDDTVLGSDTIVIIDNEVLGKPKDKDDAFKMLKRLSNRKHLVITGYTIINKDFIINKKVVSKVYFNNLDDETIKSYIDTGSPMDKAGAYGIQDKDFKLVKKIKGSFTNVMGLPKEALIKEFNKIKKKYKITF